jgi:hypothetical protein
MSSEALGVPARDAQVILGRAHIATTQQIYPTDIAEAVPGSLRNPVTHVPSV